MSDPLVVIPGFMADVRSFLPQIMYFGRTRPVILFLPTQSISVKQMALAAETVLPKSFALLGHGLGGQVAIEILRRLPKAVSRISLLATDPLPEPPHTAAAREARMVAAKSGKLAEAISHELPAAAFAEGPRKEEVLELLRKMGADLGADVFKRQSRALQRRPDQQKVLAKLKVPALILAGASDTIVPTRRQEFLAGLMPFGRAIVIPDAGHMPQLEQPEAVTGALAEFLAGPLLLR
ncbi:MAG: alpha/beta hydrolase [Tabrizicola sp.]|nr:alpha/beta hydrolase [Tabrizicola sp.]